MDLRVAIEEGNYEIVKTILDQGTDPNIKIAGFAHALQAAAWWRREEIVKLLLERGAAVNARDGRLGNALEAAADRGEIGVVKTLLDCGADVNIQGGIYDNAPCAAIRGGKEEIIKVLLDRGAGVNAQGGKYGTALQAAVAKENIAMMKILLDRGADVNAHGGKYGTALQAAAAEGNIDMVKILLDRGADVDGQGKEYEAQRPVIAARVNTDVVKVLQEGDREYSAQGSKAGESSRVAAREQRASMPDTPSKAVDKAGEDERDNEASSLGGENPQEREKVTDEQNHRDPSTKKPVELNNLKCFERIQNVLEEAVPVIRQGNGADSPLQVSVHVFWELKELMHKEFSADDRLSSVLTITGSETDAQAATCQEYISENWPRGLHLLKVVESSLADGERFDKFMKGF